MCKKKQEFESNNQIEIFQKRLIEQTKRESILKNLIVGDTLGKNNILAKKIKAIKVWSIISIVLCLSVLGIILYTLVGFICGIVILSTDWEFTEVEKNKVIYGILSIIPIGAIASLIFASKFQKKYVKKQNNH